MLINMAKFTPGAIISEIRGTIASTTFSKNAAGAIIRNRVKPINRNSAAQNIQRQLFATISSAWRGLTQEQRNSWIEATPDFPYQDSLGQTKQLTGAQLHQKLNLNLLLIGESMINSAPPQTSFPEFAVGAVAASSAAFTVAFTPDPVPAGFALVVYATRPLSAGIDFVSQSDFRLVQVEDPAADSPANIFANYTSKISGLTGQAGKKVFVEIRLVEVASGIASARVRGSAIVA
jgi:hypothetical protein